MNHRRSNLLSADQLSRLSQARPMKRVMKLALHERGCVRAQMSSMRLIGVSRMRCRTADRYRHGSLRGGASPGRMMCMDTRTDGRAEAIRWHCLPVPPGAAWRVPGRLSIRAADGPLSRAGPNKPPTAVRVRWPAHWARGLAGMRAR